MSSDSQAAIDRFVDAVWLEDGLSANTLAAYRRDLTALADWLSQSGPRVAFTSLFRRAPQPFQSHLSQSAFNGF
jgi:site-specific recombinase XerD